MKTINFIISTFILALLANTASANSVKKFKVSPLSGFKDAAKITVYSSNGESYNRIDKTKPTAVKVGINIKCKYEGKGNKAYSGNLKVPGYVATSSNEPSNFLIPHAKTASREFRFDSGQGQALSPLKVCNDELQKRLSQNASKTKYHILSEGFTVNYPGGLNIEYVLRCNATGIGKSSFDTKRISINTQYNCQASGLAKAKIPKKQPKQAKFIPMVSKVTFKANPKVKVGQCPTRINFTGHITATRKGKVSYRYIKNNGKKSRLFTLNFRKAGTMKTAKWGLTADRPKIASTIKSGQGRASQYEVEGNYRLVIESPKSNQQATASYQIDCDKAKSRTKSNGA